MAKSPSLEEIVKATEPMRRAVLYNAWRRIAEPGALGWLIIRHRIAKHPALRNVTDGK